GLLARHGAGDRRAPVAALSDVAGVAEALHQHRPGAPNAVGIPAYAGRPTGETVARHRRDNDVKGILRAAAGRGWIRSRIDDLELLDDGARPAVRNDDWQCIGVLRSHVDEMDVDAIDLGDELWQAVELPLQLPPVVAGAPVTNKPLKLLERRAL